MDSMIKRSIMVLVAFLAFAIGSNGQISDGLTVKISSGLVQGFEQEGTQAFLGIPYAEVERFMPPLPVKPWQGVRR